MENVSLIDPIKDPRWDKFVQNHPFGWIVHLSGWKTVIESSFPHIKGHYLALIDTTDNEIRAALPLFEVRSWLTGNRMVSIPFATISDPLINTSYEMEKLFEHAIELMNSLEIPSIEIRSLMSSLLINDKRLERLCFFKHHFIELKGNLEDLHKAFHPNHVKRGIKRAIKSNLSFRSAENEEDLLGFYKLYAKTRKKHGLPPQPFIFIKMLWDIFFPSKNFQLLFAEKDGQALAAMILFKFKGRVSVDFQVSDETYLEFRPNHFLYWEAIKLTYSEGFKIFDFGRTSPNNEGLMQFKSYWGTEVVDLPQFFYPKEVSNKYLEWETSTGYKFIQKLCKNSPEPIFQLLARLCYRHLG